MRLSEYVETKRNELLQGGMRSVDFKKAEECEIGKNSICYTLFGAKQIPLDAEVEEVDRRTLPDGYGRESMIPGAQVVFEVVKPRCRKTSREYLYAKAVQGEAQ